MASPEVLGISSGAAFGVVLICFWCRVMPLAGCYPRVVSGRGDAVDHYDRRRTRWIFSTPMLLAGMALSTAFTMLLMMLQQVVTREWRKF